MANLTAALGRQMDYLRASLADSQAQLRATEEQLDERRVEVNVCAARMASMDQELAELQDRSSSFTPRPPPKDSPLPRLLAQPAIDLVDQALMAGAEPLDLHRWMLGVSSGNEVLLTWVGFAGACRDINPWADAGGKKGGQGQGQGQGREEEPAQRRG